MTNSSDRGEGDKNKIISEQQRKQIRKTLKEGYASGKIVSKSLVPIYVYGYDGKFIRKFESMKEASNTLKVSKDSIRRCCQGTAMSHKKIYQFSYSKKEMPNRFIANAKVRVESEDNVLYFQSMLEANRHFNFPYELTNAKYFANMIFKLEGNKYRVFVKDKEYFCLTC